jgi:hypothetical protein
MTRGPLGAGHVALIVLVAAVMAASYLPTAPSADRALPAPHFGAAATGSAPAAPAPSASVFASATSAVAPAAASQPSTGLCPTPTGTPVWNSPSFFSDAVVSFYVPGDSAINGSQFQTVPCSNTIPTYTNGFWMYVTTNVAIAQANVTIWGTGWSTPGNINPDVANFAPATPRVMPMYLEPPYYHTAEFYFNVYEFFWPGSQIWFNITLQTLQASPGLIRSTESKSVPVYFPGGTNNATWGFYVADPWGAGSFAQEDENFSQDIQVTTTPTVLTTPAYDPNPRQPVQITLTSINPSGGPATPIPMAEGQFTLTGPTQTGVYYQYFGPFNHTTMQLVLPLGPYPGTKVQFNITAWLPWELSSNGQVGAIDRIYSQIFTFNWSDQGGWWQPTQGISGNLALSSVPDVTSTSGGKGPVFETDTPVNITLHSPIENVTIGSSALNFRYSDPNGFSTGSITMGFINSNTTYAVLPGLPPGGTLVFSVLAKDVFGNPVSSGNYTYSESGPVNDTYLHVPAGYGLFFAEALDLSTGQLVPNVNYTISNFSWHESGRGNILGFAAPVPIGGVGYLPVAWGGFTVNLSAFGNRETYTFNVASASPFTIVYYFASQPVPPDTSVTLGTELALPAILGIVGAAVVAWPVTSWFSERRRKAEAEQRRITL